LFATDYPFDLGPNFLPTLESGVFNEVELEKIYHGNAERMFTFGP
jgi:predicted TIM-barrel fold metal-dependent hydrolase